MFGPGFESNVFESGFPGNGDRWHEIVDLCLIADAPQNADSGGLGTRFAAEFGDPLASGGILDAVFFIVTAGVDRDKRYLTKVRLHFLPAGPIEQISLRNIDRFPKLGVLSDILRRLAFGVGLLVLTKCVVDPSYKKQKYEDRKYRILFLPISISRPNE